VDTLKINSITTLIKELPQTHVVELQNNLIFLLPKNYQVGNKNLPPLSQYIDYSEYNDIVDIFNQQSELLVQDINTLVLFSTKPFNLRLNLTNEILQNIYQFSYTSSNIIDVYVSNSSTTDNIDISYLYANTNLLGSSYVYT
jgi:hypothetical protein